MIHTIRQFEFVPIPASGTVLRSESWIDLNATRTGPFCLISQTFKKHPPCSVSDTFVNAAKVVFFHVVDRQVFNNNGVESVYELTRFLVRKIMPFPANPFVNTSNYLASPCSGLRSLLLFGKLPLNSGKRLFFLPEESRVLDLLIIGKSSERFQPHVDSDGWFNGFFGRFMINVTGKRYKPFSGRCTFNGAGLNCTLDRPVKLYLNTPDLGKLNYILEKFKAGLRIGEGIIPELSPESWIPGFIAGFDTSEESSESKVDSHRNVLKNLTVNIRQKRMFLFKILKRIALIISRKAFLFSIPGLFALLKKMIVKPVTSIKRLLKGCDLFVGWEYPTSKYFPHIYTIRVVLLNVKNYLKERCAFHLSPKGDGLPGTMK